jgi:hypothetical protein
MRIKPAPGPRVRKPKQQTPPDEPTSLATYESSPTLSSLEPVSQSLDSLTAIALVEPVADEAVGRMLCEQRASKEGCQRTPLRCPRRIR